MESDQLPVESNLNPLNLSDPGEPPEAIATPVSLNESWDESIGDDIPEDIPDQTPEPTAEIMAITDEASETLETLENVVVSEVKLQLASSVEAEKLDILEVSEISEQSTIITQLKQEESALKAELDHLKTTKAKVLQEQIDDLQSGIIRLAQADVARLEYQKQELQAAIAVLEKRKERLDKEMTSTYAGASQDIAIRVQGFKDYLVGSLQDLVASAENSILVGPHKRWIMWINSMQREKPYLPLTCQKDCRDVIVPKGNLNAVLLAVVSSCREEILG